MAFDRNHCPVAADTNRHYAELDREAARERFVEDRAADLCAESLASDAQLEGLMQAVFGDADVTDAMFVSIYRGDAAEFKKLVEKCAQRDAALKADAEALEIFDAR